MTAFARLNIVGDELIRINLELSGCDLNFRNFFAQMFGPFTITSKTGDSTRIDCTTRSGNLYVLWTLIGETITSFKWNDGIELTFSDGSTIRNRSEPGKIQGAFQSSDHTIYQEYLRNWPRRLHRLHRSLRL